MEGIKLQTKQFPAEIKSGECSMPGCKKFSD